MYIEFDGGRQACREGASEEGWRVGGTEQGEGGSDYVREGARERAGMEEVRKGGGMVEKGTNEEGTVRGSDGARESEKRIEGNEPGRERARDDGKHQGRYPEEDTDQTT